MAKWAFITDTHCGVRNDSPLFAEMQAKFYKEVFYPKLEEEGVTKIIHTGDYFDRRRIINIASLQMNQQYFVEPSKDYDVHLAIGNHDTFFRSTNDVNSPKALLSHCWNIYEEPGIIDEDGVRVAMVPWINPQNRDAVLKWLSEVDVDLVAGHFEFVNFEMHKGNFSTDGEDPDDFAKHPQIVSGHFHTRSEKGNIKYLGSAFEFTWADCDDPRGFHIYDTDTKEFTFYQNPIKMFHKIVFDGSQDASDYEGITDKYVKVIVTCDDAFEVDKFIDGLRAHNPYDMQIIDEGIRQEVADAAAEVDANDVQTSSIISECVEDTSLEPDVKDKVNQLLTEIYREATEE